MKWYYKPVWIIVAILAAGPFALPLVWLSPALKKWVKILLTIITLAITVWLVKATVNIYQALLKEVSMLQSIQ
jgi:hypothetical protein